MVNEPQFLWIAEEAAMAEIPPEWKEFDNENGETRSAVLHTLT